MPISDAISAGSGALSRGFNIAAQERQLGLQESQLQLSREKESSRLQAETIAKWNAEHETHIKDTQTTATAMWKSVRDEDLRINALKEDTPDEVRIKMLASSKNAAKAATVRTGIDAMFKPIAETSANAYQSKYTSRDNSGNILSMGPSIYGGLGSVDEAKIELATLRAEKEVTAASELSPVGGILEDQAKATEIMRSNPPGSQAYNDAKREYDELQRKLEQPDREIAGRVAAAEASIVKGGEDPLGPVQTDAYRLVIASTYDFTNLKGLKSSDFDLKQVYTSNDWGDREENDKGGSSSRQEGLLASRIGDLTANTKTVLNDKYQKLVPNAVSSQAIFDFYVSRGVVVPYDSLFGTGNINKIKLDNKKFADATSEVASLIEAGDFRDPALQPIADSLGYEVFPTKDSGKKGQFDVFVNGEFKGTIK